MILRIFQVLTYPGKESAFAEFLLETALPMMERTKGLVSIQAGLPGPDEPRKFSVVMVWRDLDALKAFVGEDYRAPHIDPAEDGLVEFRSISHYELVQDLAAV